MSIGERRERVAIVRRTRAQRADGGFDVTVAIHATRWASVKPVRASEAEIAGRLAGSVSYLLEFDARGADITVDDTLVWKTRDNTVLNVREVRMSPVRSLPLAVVADSGQITPDVAALFP